MDCKFISVFRLLGISRLPNDSKVELIKLSDPHLSAYLTAEPDEACLHFDRWTAIGCLVGRGIRDNVEFLEQTAKLTEENKKARQKKFKKGVFLVIEGNDTIDKPKLKRVRKLDKFAFSLNGFDTKAVFDRFTDPARRLLIATILGISSGKDEKFENVGEIGYLLDTENNNPIYIYRISGGAISASLAETLKHQTIDFVQSYGESICHDDRLNKTIELYTQSLDEATDDLRSFILAWSALEIFVNTQFKDHYDREWIGVLEADKPELSKLFFDRIKSVMKDKYRIVDKFVAMAAILDDDLALDDVETFRRLKDVRDNIAHGGLSETLPVSETQALLRKYLALHIENRL